MGEDKKLTGDPRKDFGWFSRRHETSTAHLMAQDGWRAFRSLEHVADRRAERAARTSEEQSALLNQRLGVGQGAVRERAKLKKLGAK